MAALLFPFQLSNLAKKTLEITIRGTIGVPLAYADYMSSGAGGTVTDFEKALKDAGSEVDEIRLRITSRGGDIFTAAAIRDILQAHPARVIAQIDGLAASAASWIILAADEVQMPANAWMVIHNAQGAMSGDHREMQKLAKDLESYTNDIAREYAAKSRATKGKNSTPVKEFRRLMDETSRFNGSEAFNLGLVDTVLNEVAMSADIGTGQGWRDGMPGVSDEFLPPEVLRLFDNPKTLNPKNQNPDSNEMKPEEIQSLVTNAICDAMKPVTDSLGAVENKVNAIDVKAAIAEGIKNLETSSADTASKITDLTTRLEKAENVIKSGVGNHAGGGAPIGGAGGGEGDTGEIQAPKNEAELKAALAKCNTFAEKRSILNAYDALKK